METLRKPAGRGRATLGAVVLAALAVRLVWAALVPVEPVSDSALYDAFARSIADGRGYAFPAGNLTVYWPVGTSAVYAALYRAFGAGVEVVAVFQVLLGGVLAALVHDLARRTVGRPAAVLAGLTVALWPTLVAFTTVLASELIFMTLLVAAVRVWIAERPRPEVRAALYGALIAGASYVRPTAWPLLVLMPVAAALVERRWREPLVSALVAVVVASACFAPWVVRNHALFDRFVFIAANGGVNLWMGNNPSSTGGYMPLPDDAPADEVERDRVLGREALAYIRGAPLRYLELCARRVASTYDRESIGVVWNEAGWTRRFGPAALTPMKALAAAYWWAVVLLALAGTVLLATGRRSAAIDRGRRPVWPVLLVLGYLVAIPVLTVGGDRYHLPADPFLAIVAGLALHRAAVAARARWRPALPPPAPSPVVDRPA